MSWLWGGLKIISRDLKVRHCPGLTRVWCWCRVPGTAITTVRCLSSGSPQPRNSTPYKTVPVSLSLHPSLIFPSIFLTLPVHRIEFSYYIFWGFHAIYIFLSSNINNSGIERAHRENNNWFMSIWTEYNYINNHRLDSEMNKHI